MRNRVKKQKLDTRLQKFGNDARMTVGGLSNMANSDNTRRRQLRNAYYKFLTCSTYWGAGSEGSDIRDSHIGATVHTFLHNLSGKGTNELDRSDLCWILLCIVLCCQEKKAVDAHASAHEQAIASLVSRLNTVLATDPWHLQR